MEHNVRELNLHVRVRQGCEPSVRSSVEEFTVSVLRKTAALLEQKLPDYCVFIKEVDLRLQLPELDLIDAVKAQQIAQQFAQRIRREPPVSLPINSSEPDKDIAVFESEAHWRAGFFYALTHQQAEDAWFFRALKDEPHPLEFLSREANHDLAWSVMQVLAARHQLVAVFRKLDRPQLNRFCDRLVNIHASLKQLTEQPSSSASAQPENPLVNILIKELNSLAGDLNRSAATVLFYCYGSAVYFEADKLQSFIKSCFYFLDNQDEPTPGRHTNPASDALDHQFPTIAKNIDPLSTSKSPSVNVSQSDAPLEKHGEQATVITVPSQYAGVFYLLNPALELNTGEWLWQACLPEPQVFLHALMSLLGNGAENDIAVELFSGAKAHDALSMINEEQQQEVSQNLLLSLVKAIPRRGLAQYPVVHIELVEQANGRLLIAHEPCSPFCLFAWPAQSTNAVLEGLDIFLKCWSYAAPSPQAPPRIAELDITGRIQYMYKEIETGEAPVYLLPAESSLANTALLGQVIGCMCYLLDKRASDPLAVDRQSFVSHYIEVPANLEISADRIVVSIDTVNLNHRLRKTGADSNPGWVPWLERKIEFNFYDSEP
jgi:hypothetical protein